MATTHISLAKHLNGQPVVEGDLKVGLVIYYPSGMGGVFSYRCVSVSDDAAVFSCEDKDWPRKLEMKFSQPDFTLTDFENLSEALKAFNSFGSMPTPEQRAIVCRAHELGYANKMSFTQAHWSERGISLFKELEGKGA